jgi:MoaA/NifB/PqqE/SkfB family radical SAM enzyme
MRGGRKMRNITANKLLQYPERIAGDFRPITADVFLTNFCNNRCSWCTYNRWEHDPAANYMQFDDFRIYADKLISLGVQGIILTGGGEPTINKDFDRITEYLEKQGIHYGVNSNFNKARYFKPDYLKVSLDGYDEDSYEKVRNVRSYRKVIENIRSYIEWKKKNSPETSVGIQIVITDPDDIYKFYEANSDLDVDYIVFRPLESTNGKYYNEKNAADVLRAVQMLDWLADIDKRVVINYKWAHLNTRFSSCTAHWAQIAIDEKGNVIYCCHKPYEIIGHIMDVDILEKYKSAKTNMALCDVPCRMTAPNLVFDEVTKPVANAQFI